MPRQVPGALGQEAQAAEDVADAFRSVRHPTLDHIPLIFIRDLLKIGL